LAFTRNQNQGCPTYIEVTVLTTPISHNCQVIFIPATSQQQ